MMMTSSGNGRLALAGLMLCLAPACGLSDKYYIDQAAGNGGTGAPTDSGGSSGTATGGSQSDGGSGGLPKGSGGTSDVGGSSAVGGTSDVGGSNAAGGNVGGTSDSGGTSGTSGGGSGGAPSPVGGTDGGGTGGGGMSNSGGTGGSDTSGTGGTDGNMGGEGGAPPSNRDPHNVNNCTQKTPADGGHLYLLCTAYDASEYVTWKEAEALCAGAGEAIGLGMSFALASIDDETEDAVVKGWLVFVPNAGVRWLGANDLTHEGTWTWGRGAGAVEFLHSGPMGPMPTMGAYNGFASDHPLADGADIDCAGYDSEQTLRWNDVACDVPQMGFLCEQTD